MRTSQIFQFPDLQASDVPMSSRNIAPSPTPVPLAKVALLGAILLANNTSIWMIFSFLPFMVSFYYPTLPTTELGFEAGLLGSAFSAGGLIGNLVSGIISDKVGRRPALLWGLAGTAVSSLCFGFAPTYWFAVAARFMWGALNGNIGVAKTYLAEISDDTNMARSMAYFGVIGSTGRVIGPIIGGLLSYPAESFSIFRHTAFEAHPFALPALVVSANCVLIFIIAYFYLPETLNVKAEDDFIISSGSGEGRKSNNSSSKTSRDGLQYSALRTSDADAVDSMDTSHSSSHNRRDLNGSAVFSPRASTAIDGGDIDSSIELPLIRNGSSSTSTSGTSEQGNPMLSAEALGRQRFALLGAGDKRFSGETDEESETESKDGDGERSGLEMAVRVNGSLPAALEPGGTAVSEGLSLPLNGTSSKHGRSRKAISFSSHVRVKVIDTSNIFIQGLKQVGPEEAPLTDPLAPNRPSERNSSSSSLSSAGSAGDDEESQLRGVGDGELQERLLIPAVRYSNGAEYFESVDSSHQSLLSNLSYLMRQRHVVITTTLYGLSSFVVIIGNEIFTLWVVTSPADGGLAYNTKQIGTAIMACGIVATVLQLTLYPAATDYLGVLRVHRYGGLAFGASCVLVPMLGWGAADRPAMFTMVLAVMALTMQAVAANWYLVSTFVLISNSCYRHQLATVNGIGQTCASIGRLCGPYLGSVLFAWSETNGLAWPFNQYFVFYVLCVLAWLIYQYSLFLSRSIQRRKREPRFRTWEEGEEYLRRQQLHLEQEEEKQREEVDEEGEGAATVRTSESKRAVSV